MIKLPIFFIVIALTITVTIFFLSPKEIFIQNKCNLQVTGTCQLKSSNALIIKVSVNPFPISPLIDTEYKVMISGSKEPIESVSLRISGHDMNMNENQNFNLIPVNDNSNTYKATRLFPTCTEKVMTWRIFMLIKSKNTWIKSLFDLKVKK